MQPGSAQPRRSRPWFRILRETDPSAPTGSLLDRTSLPALRHAHVLALSALVALLGAWTWRFVLGLELLGWDSYPMIAAGRVRGVGELAGTFFEKLMDGRFPHGDYYRPIAHLSFALDHALYGLAPWGYHLTDLLILSASAGLCCAFVARASGSLAGGAAAGLAWVLHPAHFEVVTAAARRADSLAVLFLLLALVVEAGRGPWSRSSARTWVTTLACALSVASKETGAIAPLVLFVWMLGVSAGSTRARLGAALARTKPALAAVLCVLALRAAVLGGLGGDRRVALVAALTELPETAWNLVRGLATRALGPGSSAGLVTVALLVLISALLVHLARKPREERARLSLGAGAYLALGWFLGIVALTAISGVQHDWYQLPGLAPWAVACGLLVAGGIRELRAASLMPAVAALALGATMLGIAASAAPPLRSAPEFTLASTRTRALLDRFDHVLANARPGELRRLGGFASVVDVPLAQGDARRIHLLNYYSLQSYAELTHPELSVRVVLPKPQGNHAQPGEIVVVFAPEGRRAL